MEELRKRMMESTQAIKPAKKAKSAPKAFNQEDDLGEVPDGSPRASLPKGLKTRLSKLNSKIGPMSVELESQLATAKSEDMQPFVTTSSLAKFDALAKRVVDSLALSEKYLEEGSPDTQPAKDLADEMKELVKEMASACEKLADNFADMQADKVAQAGA